MPENYDALIRKMEAKLQNWKKKSLPPGMHCPKCGSSGLKFEPESGRLWCPDCGGFEIYIPIFK